MVRGDSRKQAVFQWLIFPCEDHSVCLRTSRDGDAGPDDGVFQFCSGFYRGFRADDTAFLAYRGIRVNGGIRVDGIVTCATQMCVDFTVGLWISNIKPVALIKNHGTEEV